jgi:deazaflavin-dependent oxidoreductase (nitroreductase family)
MQPWTALEAQFYRTLNRFVEPPVRAGLGSPCVLLPNGLIVLETIGRRSGRTHRTPVVATLFGGRLFVSTVRGQSSQWLKNLAATPELRYWQAGRPHDADALVFTPNDTPAKVEALPPVLRPAVSFLNALGIGVAVVTPRSTAAGAR